MVCDKSLYKRYFMVSDNDAGCGIDINFGGIDIGFCVGVDNGYCCIDCNIEWGINTGVALVLILVFVLVLLLALIELFGPSSERNLDPFGMVC